MGVTGKLRELRWRAAGHMTRPLGSPFIDPLRGSAAFEVGGPSAVFGPGGLLPVYTVVDRIDACQWAADTVWHGKQVAGDFEPAGEGGPRGRLYITEGGTLAGVPDASYDAVISSHVIEHLANPLGALAHWRRVARPAGYLLIVAPHLAGTFDHRRPVTTLEHLVADFEAATDEDDLTHLDEVLRLHDPSRDPAAGERATFEEARRDNLHTRLLHHHTFTGRSLLALLDRAGVEILAAEVRYPHDAYCLARFADPGDPPVNTHWLDVSHPVWRRSPFRIDRRRD
jgi:SAM-dependent methyltransferase